VNGYTTKRRTHSSEACPSHCDIEWLTTVLLWLQRCPFLLRVFVRVNRPLRIAEFDDARRLPEDELQVYTWPDATLSELATLVMEVEPSPRRRRANLRFATVYRPQTGGGKPMLRDLGKITVGQTVRYSYRFPSLSIAASLRLFRPSRLRLALTPQIARLLP
jgi:hypothetical protein